MAEVSSKPFIEAYNFKTTLRNKITDPDTSVLSAVNFAKFFWKPFFRTPLDEFTSLFTCKTFLLKTKDGCFYPSVFLIKFDRFQEILRIKNKLYN